jgi:hypothetical protein
MTESAAGATPLWRPSFDVSSTTKADPGPETTFSTDDALPTARPPVRSSMPKSASPRTSGTIVAFSSTSYRPR